MKFLRKFNEHTSYEAELNSVGVDISLPNVSYCEDVKDVHYTPYNLVRFYVGEISGTTPQTVKIYTNNEVFNEVQVSKGNKWYSYVLPKDKGLCKIESGIYDGEQQKWSNGIVTKAVVKANINYNFDADKNKINGIVPWEITEASFKGSDTSKVTNMSGMFNVCTNLTSLDLSSFDTSKVTNMESMFNECSGLTSLDVSSFDTSKVTNMNNMFKYCSNLTSLDLSSFNTSNVTNMGQMFYGCPSLTSLDVSNFDTSKVTSMHYMFDSCKSLISLDLSGWNTSNVTDMALMFDFCGSLAELNLSGWVISDGTSMNGMFNACTSLNTIKMVDCTTETITKIEEALTAAGIKDNVEIKTT